MPTPKHGGSIKRSYSHTRQRHEARMRAQQERLEAHRAMAEQAAEELENYSKATELPIDEQYHSEPQVVIVQQIAREIREFNRKWLSGRTQRESRNGEVMGPVQWLSQKTEINIRQIARITNEEVQTVGLSDAEKILIALDLEYLLSNGEIHIIPNPRWSLEKWVAYMQAQGCV